jgi:single-strand DNA-binding protein
VARLRIATTERIYNRQTQETKEHTEWHTVVLWRGLADVADKYVRKGSQIYIEGKIRSNEWTDKDGGKRYGIEIVADDLKLLGRRSENSGGSAPQYSAPAPAGGSSYSAPAAPAAQPAAYQSAPAPVPVDDPDDLPF